VEEKFNETLAEKVQRELMKELDKASRQIIKVETEKKFIADHNKELLKQIE